MNSHDDIVTRLRRLADRCDHGHPNWGEGFYPAPVHCNTCITYREMASEVELLQSEVIRWKDLCERTMAYQSGSDWQDIRIAYEMALEDYNAQRSS